MLRTVRIRDRTLNANLDLHSLNQLPWIQEQVKAALPHFTDVNTPKNQDNLESPAVSVTRD